MFCTGGLVLAWALTMHVPHHHKTAIVCSPTLSGCFNQWNGAANALGRLGLDYHKVKLACEREPKVGGEHQDIGPPTFDDDKGRTRF